MSERVVVDCSTGESRREPLTAAELAQRARDLEAATVREAANDAERLSLLRDAELLTAYQANATPTAAQTAVAVSAQTRLMRRLFTELKGS